ncbi:Maf family protein [Algiphilus sp.]|uniref:Maf family protein n=1 Tax=Algiphilus sp. TaxID=1872431 RepID=UPI003B52D5A4
MNAPGAYPPPLLLASTSPYRARLLQRLRLTFDTCAPAVDEEAEPATEPGDRARRLASLKARAVARQHPEHWVIGSDQVASCVGRILSKPGSAEQQKAQLQWLSGKTAEFHTAVALVYPDGGRRRERQRLVRTRVRFRPLDSDAINRYVDAEPAADCCGGFKCEGLGITLFKAVQSPDPTALEGLPLIATATLLRQAGLLLP